MENEPRTDSREWELEAETEYRFELDPGTSLAIKVRPKSVLSAIMQQFMTSRVLHSSFRDRLKFLVMNLQKISNICLALNAKHPYSLGKDARSR